MWKVRRFLATAFIVVASACGSNSNSQQTATSSSAPSGAPAPAATLSLTAVSFGASLPAGPEFTTLQADCEICHGREMWASQRLSHAVWEAEITKMIGFGAPVPKSQKEALVNYLTRYLGPSIPRIGNAPTAPAPAISFTGPPQ